jgi:hypothetical protein
LPALIDRRPLARAAVLFALVFGAYAFFYQAGGWNQNSRFDLVRALVEGHTASIDAYHGNTKDKARREKIYYSDKAPGASWLAVPAYLAVRAIADMPPGEPEFLALSSYAATVFSVALPSALGVVALDLLLAALGLAAWPRAAIALAYGLGTLAFPYSTLFYGHQLAAALLVGGFALLVRARHRRDGAPAGRGALFGAGLLFGAAVAAEYPAALAAGPFGLYAAACLRPRTRLVWLAAGVALPALAVAAYHAAVFGSPLALPYDFSTRRHRHQGFFMGLGAPRPEALWHLLLSPFRGLFFSSPWLLFAVPGAVRLLRDRRLRPEALSCLAATLLLVWMNASLVDWDGGWALGARYLIPALPFLAVLAAGCALRRDPPQVPSPTRWTVRAAWGAGLAAGALSVVLMLAGTAVKPEVPNTLRRPFADFVLPAFAAGRLAQNTQGIDDLEPVDGGPPQAWNLGQRLFGLDGLASLLPLAGLWLAGAVALVATDPECARVRKTEP